MDPQLDSETGTDVARLARVVDLAADWCGSRRTGRHALASAQDRARALLAAAPDDPMAAQLAVTTLTADCFGALWMERTWSRREVEEMLKEVAGIAGQPPRMLTTAVALELLRDPRFLGLPPRMAIEAQLQVVTAFSSVEGVSLWIRDGAERPSCSVAVGPARSRRAMATARSALSGTPETDGRARMLRAMPVLRWERAHAALVVRSSREEWERCLPIVTRAAEMLGALLERESLLERSAARERALVAASERRLTRLGYDIHDEPVQIVAALGADVALFRRQLRRLTLEEHERDVVAGRVEDFQARLEALDAELRSICHSVESGTMLARPFAEALEREVGWSAKRSDIEVGVRVDGDLDSLSDSQRIALFRIIQECLSNVREHSGATDVEVDVRADHGHVEARVRDNGRGFDVERTLIQAARRGRLGLVGLHERARLLGGTCIVTSRAGGPTTVSVVLPRWEPQPVREAVPAGLAAV